MYVWEKKEKEFQNLQHGSILVNHYASKFIQLSQFVPKFIATENKKTRKFLKGLRADIFNQVAMMKSTTYIEALKNVLLVKELLVACYQHTHNARAQH